jgi:hypothetical protein
MKVVEILLSQHPYRVSQGDDEKDTIVRGHNNNGSLLRSQCAKEC